MLKLTIPARVWGALSLFRARGDVRNYLNGLAFERGPAGSLVAIATDAHRLSAYSLDESDYSLDCDPTTAANWEHQRSIVVAIDDESIERAMRAYKYRNESLTIAIDGDESDASGSVTLGPTHHDGAARLIAGRYPDWRRIVRDRLAETPSAGCRVSVDSRYLSTYYEAGRVLSGARSSDNAPSVWLETVDPASPMIVQVAGLWGMLMPRSEDQLPAVPHWMLEHCGGVPTD